MERHPLVRHARARPMRTIAAITTLALLPLVVIGTLAGGASAAGSTVTTPSLTSGANPAGSNEFITFTATVPGVASSSGTPAVTPTGTVRLLDGATMITQGPLNASGTVVFNYVQLTVGTHSIKATYQGDATYAAADSNSISQVINGGEMVSGTVVNAVSGVAIAGSPVAAVGGNGISNTVSSTNGNYSFTLDPGHWSIVANPPPGGSEVADVVEVDVVAGQSITGKNIALTAPIPMPPGTTFDSPSSGQQSSGTNNGNPVIFWGELIQFTTTQCPNGTVTITINTPNAGGALPPIDVAEVPLGSGVYSVQIDGPNLLLPDHHGTTLFTLTVTCPGDEPIDSGFTGYIDPSGTVVDTDGNLIFGATVTLLHSTSFGGTYTAVPDGSAVMSPSNRVNPWSTGSDGAYAWDVMPGFYRVTATAPDCSTTTSQAFAIPPEVTGLTLTLTCAAGAGPQVRRFAGADRVGTSVIVSQGSFAPGQADAVVLARSDAFADALASGPLAAALGGPLLLTPTGELDSRVRAEIARALPAGGRVNIVGGVGAVSDAVKDSLTSAGFSVNRIAGEERYATAVAVADAVVAAMGHPALSALLATGVNFPDGLVAGAAAAHESGVVLLTSGGEMPAPTAAWLAAHPTVTTYAIGGPAAAAAPSADPVVGSDRYSTATMVASKFFSDPTLVGVVSGIAFPDALVGAARVGAAGAPLVLSAPDALSSATRTYLTDLSPHVAHFEIYGGTGALSATAEGALQSLAS